MHTLGKIILGIGLSAMLFGFLFKMMHWPMGSEMLIVGTLVTVIGIWLFLFTKPNPMDNSKKPLDVFD